MLIHELRGSTKALNKYLPSVKLFLKHECGGVIELQTLRGIILVIVSHWCQLNVIILIQSKACDAKLKTFRRDHLRLPIRRLRPQWCGDQ